MCLPSGSIDEHVGKRIRLLRGLRKLSQVKLAEVLGITSQQVQKYERGANRVGAGRLYEIAQCLNVPVGFFFDEMDGYADLARQGLQEEQAPFEGGAPKSEDVNTSSGEGTPDGGMELLMKPETLELAKAYYRIKDEKIRQQLLNFVRDVAERS